MEEDIFFPALRVAMDGDFLDEVDIEHASTNPDVKDFPVGAEIIADHCPQDSSNQLN